VTARIDGRDDRWGGPTSAAGLDEAQKPSTSSARDNQSIKFIGGLIAHLSRSSRDIGGVADMISWLETRLGTGWFYVTGVNFHFRRPRTPRISGVGSPAGRRLADFLVRGYPPAASLPIARMMVRAS
jgi:hypothetical protein